MITNDPISDMLTRIRNGSKVFKAEIEMPYSKMKEALADILKTEGYIEEAHHLPGVATDSENQQRKTFDMLKLGLKYIGKKPMITSIKRVSKPGRRVYCTKDTLPIVLDHMGIAIISTSKGVMTNKQARKEGVGGEVICEVY